MSYNTLIYSYQLKSLQIYYNSHIKILLSYLCTHKYLLTGIKGNFVNFNSLNPCPSEPRYTVLFANSVDPDQLASEEAEANWTGSALFVIGSNVNLYQHPGSSNMIGWNFEKGATS